jgi:hypothetical protein
MIGCLDGACSAEWWLPWIKSAADLVSMRVARVKKRMRRYCELQFHHADSQGGRADGPPQSRGWKCRD